MFAEKVAGSGIGMSWSRPPLPEPVPPLPLPAPEGPACWPPGDFADGPAGSPAGAAAAAGRAGAADCLAAAGLADRGGAFVPADAALPVAPLPVAPLLGPPLFAFAVLAAAGLAAAEVFRERPAVAPLPPAALAAAAFRPGFGAAAGALPFGTAALPRFAPVAPASGPVVGRAASPAAGLRRRAPVPRRGDTAMMFPPDCVSGDIASRVDKSPCTSR
ncbi:MAG: hypothetical protein RIB84_08570 [Sneathiellaceae bacterium]